MQDVRGSEKGLNTAHEGEVAAESDKSAAAIHKGCHCKTGLRGSPSAGHRRRQFGWAYVMLPIHKAGMQTLGGDNSKQS